MKNLLLSSAAIALGASAATAGGLDRSQQSTTYLFGEPHSANFFIARVNPSITGKDVAGAGNGDYNIGNSFNQVGATALHTVDENWSFGFQYDQAFGGDVFYNGDPGTAALAGTKADFAGNTLNFMAKYKVNDRVSVFGGVRAQQSGGEVALGGQAYTRPGLLGSAAFQAQFVQGVRDEIAADRAGTLGPLVVPISAALSEDVILAAAATGTDAAPAAVAELTAILPPFIPAATVQRIAAGLAQNAQTAFDSTAQDIARAGFYDVDVKDSWGYGYTLGAAYEIPDIALRAVLTYHSEVDHTSDTTEMLAGVRTDSEVDFTTPQSVNFDFQTGIAADTLLTFSYRWAEWGTFDIVPTALNRDLADLDDSQRYSIGVARRVNDALALSATITHEASSNDDNVSPLSPTDGETGLSLGVRYESDGLIFSGGVGYTWVGDADAGVADVDVANFESNSVTSVGFRVTYEF